MIISIYTAEAQISTRLAYIIDFLNRHPYLPKNHEFVLNQPQADLSIYYQSRKEDLSKNEYLIPKQNLFFKPIAYDNIGSLIANPYVFSDKTLFSVEDIPARDKPFIYQNNFGFDIFEMIFFHLARYEEYYAQPQFKDIHSYLKEEYHFLCRWNLDKKPVVDMAVAAFLESLGITPAFTKYRNAISHDIDALLKFPSLYKTIRGFIRLLIIDGAIHKTWKYWSQYFEVITGNCRDPYDIFEWLLTNNKDLDKYLFILVGGKSKYEGFYSINNSRLKEIIVEAQKKGYNIGLHPSYNSSVQSKLISDQKKELENLISSEIIHSRQHFLRFDFSKTPQALAEAGIKYDHSMGYQNRIGFRSGTAFPYVLFSIKENRQLSLVEKPFSIMDTALVTEAQNNNQSISDLFNGFLSGIEIPVPIYSNFHNSSFDELRPGGRELTGKYHSIIQNENHL